MKQIIIFLIIILFISGIVNTTHIFRFLQIPMLFLGTILLSLISYKSFINANVKPVIVFCGIAVFISGIMSALLNADNLLFVNSLAMFAIFIVFILGLPEVQQFPVPTDIALYIIFLYLSVALLSYFTNHINLVSYKGITYNPNSFGTLNCSFFTIFITLPFNYQKWSYRLLSVWSLFNVIISSCRGAFISCLILYFLRIFFWLKYEKKISLIQQFKVIILIVLIGCFYFILPIKNIVSDSIISKFEKKSEVDVTGGRYYIWYSVLEGINFFGHERNYFNKAFHSTYISILGQYGIVGLFFYLSMLIVFLQIGFNHARKYKDCFPIMTTISFLLMSITEGMLMKLSMFLMYYSVTYCLYVEKSNLSKSRRIDLKYNIKGYF